MMHGKGLFTWEDGRSYGGDFNENLREGVGIFIWPDSRKYYGNFKNNQFHGEGQFTSTEGKSRAGEWEHGQLKCWNANDKKKGPFQLAKSKRVQASARTKVAFR
jgi:hypothetical protein